MEDLFLHYTIEDEDMPYEEDLLRNPYNLKAWLRFLEFKQDSVPLARFCLFERALLELPGSYKLWDMYLRERSHFVRGKPLTDPEYERLNIIYERSLVFMNRMPIIWLSYLRFLMTQKKITRTRRSFDRALRSLPITQHHLLWEEYLPYTKTTNVPLGTLRVFRRCLKLFPEKIEEYIDFLCEEGFYNEAAEKLAQVVNDEHFVSRQGKTKQALWLQLCTLLAEHPSEIKSLPVDAIIRGGILKYNEEIGDLWVSLAQYYIRLSHFEKARDIFEEGMESVMTVHDFSKIWDAYTEFEDGMIATQLEHMELEETGAEDFDLRVARYEDLISRQPLLVNSVLLRQNPHSVSQWLNRVRIYEEMETENDNGDNDMSEDIVSTFTEALERVDPLRTTERLSLLWIGLAHFYAHNGDLTTARSIFEKGYEGRFKLMEDLANLWCASIELEISHGNYSNALSLCQKAVATSSTHPQAAERRLHKSLRIWLLYADLEESFGTYSTTKAVYDRIIDLKIVTPLVILRFGQYLEELRRFEDMFQAYEKGVTLFHFPHSRDIWMTYLTKFVSRFGASKMERARDLFEQVLSQVPPNDSITFYVLYANLEEHYGLARRAIAIYERALGTLSKDDLYKMYLLYINRATEFFGVTKTRTLFETAMGCGLSDIHTRHLGVKYAELEEKLGEIDRARAIYIHTAQFVDPRLDEGFWKLWRDFEVKFGNDDTFREMLRIKRSVQASFSTSNINITEMQTRDSSSEPLSMPMKALEAEKESELKQTQKEKANPDEILLDDDNEDEH